MPEKLVTVQNDPALDTVEQYIREICESENAVVLLPTRSRHRLGLHVALLQMLATWSRHAAEPVLRTYVRPEPDLRQVDLKSLCSSVVGLTAAILAKKVLAKDSTVECTAEAREAARQTVLAMERGEAKFQRGTTFAVMCFDNTSRALQPEYYYPGGEVKTQEHFVEIFRRFLMQCEVPLRQGESTQTMRSIGVFLYELFRNTHDHARVTITGRPIRRSARGILVSQIRGRAEIVQRTHGTYGPLSEYLDSSALQGSDGVARVVEVSIVDSGPGLARRFLSIPESQKFPWTQERAATIDCFKKYHTSKPTPLTGRGLNGTLVALSQVKAFFTLRTGRVRLYRNFVSQPYCIGDEVELEDWPRGARENLAEASGAAYSIFFPVPR